MEKLSRYSVDQPITILMIMLAIILLGIISFQRLGIEILPDLNNPSLFIELEAGEKPPEEIEDLYVEQIESLASRQKGAVDVSSRIRTGSALVEVEYSWETDMDGAFLDLQKSMNDLAQQMDFEEVSVTDYDPNAQPVMSIAMYSDELTDMDELRRTAENYIRNELIRIDGIAEVKIYGSEEKEVLVETDPYLLEAFGLTSDEISSEIEAFNQNISGGSVEEMGLKYVIKGVSILETIDDIKNLVVSYRRPGEEAANGEQDAISSPTPIFLKDVAHVAEKNKDPDNIVYINGRRCLGLGIYKETKYNTVEAVEKLSNRLEEIGKALPGFSLVTVDNQADYINSAIREVEQAALIGIILAIVVLYAFLRRIGTTAIISVSIPVSVIATFSLMYFKGLSLNIMTLGGLALGAGMLVDNAIVVVESIVRNIETGNGVRESAIKGTAQVSGAITAATITTIIVFLPIVYIRSVAGELFKDQALTVGFSLLSSLVVAVLFIPMLSSRVLREPAPDAKNIGKRYERYGALLETLLENRALVVITALLLVVGTVFLIPVVGSEFIPDTEMNEFSVNLSLPAGTALERTAETVVDIEKKTRRLLGDEIEIIYSVAGPIDQAASQGTDIFQDENTASLKIILASGHKTESKRLIGRMSQELSGIPGTEIQFVENESALKTILGTEAAPVIVEISGDDLDSLRSVTERISAALSSQDDLFNIETSFERGRPELNIHIDRLQAGILGIGIDELTSQLEDRLMGREAGSWDKSGEKLDITIRFPKLSPAELLDFSVAKNGERILLEDFATIREGFAPEEIKRRNQKRIGTVSAYYREGRAFDHIIGETEDVLEEITIPHGYEVEIRGEEHKRRASFSDLKFALILSIVLVYMVLASQFESLVHPFTILLTIPLAGVGAVLIFLMVGKPLSIMAYIGIIMLAGIAVNDSIILVDTINRIKRQGIDGKTAIIKAGKERIRPIVMTSVTTVLALLPLTLGIGEGAALRAPMALAVIGGLVTSTILTLIVIPCVYSVLDSNR